MHDDIKRFHLEGEIADANIVEAKARMVHFLETGMRDDGYVPELALETQFTLDYVAEHEKYNFVLSVYGVHVGREQACRLSGVVNGKTVMKYTPPTKSKQS